MSLPLESLARRCDEHMDGADGERQTAIAGLTLMRASEPSQPYHMLYRPTLCLIVQGAKRMMFDDQILHYRAGQSLVVSIDVPAVGRVTEASRERPYLGISVELDLTVMREVMAQMHLASPTPPRRHPPVLFVEPAHPAIGNCMHRLLDMLEQPQAVPVLYPLLMREVFYWLLSGRNRASLMQLAAPAGPAQRIVEAIQHLRQAYARPLPIRALADIAGMSTSSFHQHFKALTSMTPLSYQKRLRLIEARRLLLADTATVAEAAFRVGYESSSQFSREYVRMFGLPPGRDAAARRSAA